MTPAEEPSPAPGEPAAPRWYQKVASVFYAIFCFEVGLFLLVLPWVTQWEQNYLADFPLWRAYWNSYYFRGAVSGLGVFNIYLSFVAVFQLRRFSSPE